MQSRLTHLLLIGSTLLASCSRPAAPPDLTAVETEFQPEVILVNRQPWPTVVRCQGSLLCDSETTVAARVNGRIKALPIDLGQPINVGMTLAELDPVEYKLQLAAAEAQLAQARAAIGLTADQDHKLLDPENSPPVREARAVLEEANQQAARMRQLFDDGAVSDAELLTAQSAADVANARYASALNLVREKLAIIDVAVSTVALNRQSLEDTVVASPLEGIVQNRMVAEGDYVTAGQALMVVVRTSVLRFRGTIPQRYAEKLAVGQKIRIRTSANGDPREATISRIIPSLDALTRSLAFEADIENADQQLRGGMFAEAEVEIDPNAKQIVVPNSAVVKFAGIEKVWKVEDGMVRENVVQLGPGNDQQVVVLDGLAVGDVILLNGSEGQTRPVDLARLTRADAASTASTAAGTQ